MKNLFLIVILPVVSGVLINTFYQHKLGKIKSLLPLISVLFIAKNQVQIFESGLLVFTNVFGLFAGYVIPRLMRYDQTICKTISIEVGMQNSGLAAVLASQYFSVVAALPSALFSIWHNITGSLLVIIWSREEK